MHDVGMIVARGHRILSFAQRTLLPRRVAQPAEVPTRSELAREFPSPTPGALWRNAPVVHAAVLALYVALACYLYSKAWLHQPTVVAGDLDAKLFAWFIAWDWYSISHLQNPFLTDHLAYPSGINVMWNTSLLPWGVLFGPVTANFGPTVTLTLLGTLGLCLTGYNTFLLARHWACGVLAAAFAGLFVEIGPFMYVHAASSHLHMLLGAMWLPLLALLTSRLARAQGSPIRTGLLLGLCITAALYSAEEVVAAGALVFSVGLVLAAVLYRRQVFRASRHFVTGAVVGVLTFGLLAAVPLAYQLWGAQNVTGRDIQGDFGGSVFYSLDLANLVVPTYVTRIAPTSMLRIASHMIGTPAEQVGYLGIPVLALLLIAAVALWRDVLVRWLLLAALATTVFALGAVPHIAGHPLAVKLPLELLRSAPLYQNLVPVRLMLFVDFAAAIVLAKLLDLLLRRYRTPLLARAAAVTMVALSIATILPHSRIPTTAVSVPAYLRADVPTDATVVIFPYPTLGEANSMYWAAAAGARYKLVGGYVIVPDPTRPKASLFSPRTVTQEYWARVVQSAGTGVSIDESLVRREQQELRDWHIQYVVLVPQLDNRLQAAAVQHLVHLLGQPPKIEDGALVWALGVDGKAKLSWPPRPRPMPVTSKKAIIGAGLCDNSRRSPLPTDEVAVHRRFLA